MCERMKTAGFPSITLVLTFSPCSSAEAGLNQISRSPAKCATATLLKLEAHSQASQMSRPRCPTRRSSRAACLPMVCKFRGLPTLQLQALLLPIGAERALRAKSRLTRLSLCHSLRFGQVLPALVMSRTSSNGTKLVAIGRTTTTTKKIHRATGLQTCGSKTFQVGTMP